MYEMKKCCTKTYNYLLQKDVVPIQIFYFLWLFYRWLSYRPFLFGFSTRFRNNPVDYQNSYP